MSPQEETPEKPPFSYDALLQEIDNHMLRVTCKDTITFKDFRGILMRAFRLEDIRTHRNKRDMLVSMGYLHKVPKVKESYCLTDDAFAQLRKLKGVPVPIGTPNAEASEVPTSSQVLEGSTCIPEDDELPAEAGLAYLKALQRGGGRA